MKIHFLYFPTFHISHLYTFCFHIFTQFHPPQQPFNFSFQPKLNFSSYFSVSTIASNDILLYTTSTVCVSEFCAQLRLCFSHVYTFFLLKISQFVCFSSFPHAHKSLRSRKVETLYWHRIFIFCFSSLFSLSPSIFLLFSFAAFIFFTPLAPFANSSLLVIPIQREYAVVPRRVDYRNFLSCQDKLTLDRYTSVWYTYINELMCNRRRGERYLCATHLQLPNGKNNFIGTCIRCSSSLGTRLQ